MTEHSLSGLYRQMSAQQRMGAVDLLDADTLVAASMGTLRGDRRDEVASQLSRSPAQTDLVRMLGELAPVSAELAAAVGERHVRGHMRATPRIRHGSSERRPLRHVRWIGLAACMMLVFGAVFWQPRVTDPASVSAHSETLPDRIFTNKDRIFAMTEVAPAASATDDVFRSDFNDG